MMAEFNHETSNLANRLSVEEAGEVIKQISLGDEEYQKAILAPDFVERCNANCFNPERRLCGVGISSCCMVANGNVYPCPGWQEMVLGNLKEDTLQNIWDNSEKIKWLRGLKMKDIGNGECCKCDKAAFCALVWFVMQTKVLPEILWKSTVTSAQLLQRIRKSF